MEPAEQRAAAALEANAAQAGALATMMSTPNELRGDAAGRKISGGEEPVTLADAGKAITREGATVALRDRLPLQGRATVALEGGIGAGAAHVPAVAAVVDALAQHRQEVQPTVCKADAAQQQPPRQVLVPQSKAEAQGSPGELRRQEPEPGKQPLHPERSAVREQQTLERQAPVAQEALLVQAEPGARAVVSAVPGRGALAPPGQLEPEGQGVIA